MTTTLVALGVFGAPFGTSDLGVGERLIYWGVVMVGIAAIMECLLYLAVTHPEMRRLRYHPLILGTVALAAIPGAVVVVSVETLISNEVITLTGLLRIWAAVTLIGFVVALVEYPPSARQTVRRPMGETDDAEAVAGRVFLNRLDPGMGTNVISLSIRDHYLEVVTGEGRQMLLLSLADAEAELEDYPGLRIHRSHWVALDAVEGLTRSGHKWQVETAAGDILPVSREIGPTLKAALDAHAAR